MSALKKLSAFDLGMIIAFVVVALLGAGAWWYLSGQLQTATDQVKSDYEAFNRYSVSKGTGPDSIVVSPSNGKILQNNIDLLTAQINPLIQANLLAKDNTMSSIANEDPVAWKQRLDDDVHRLTAAAKIHGVTLPPNFYFGFSRYLSQSPRDEQTAVLTKQLLGIDRIADILINTPVKNVTSIRRTYEEDARPTTGNQGPSFSEASTESDRVNGTSITAPGGIYTDYPFEVDFETTSEGLRPILDGLIHSPYVFIVRTLTIANTLSSSPQLADLDRLAGSPTPSVVSSSPGEVASTTSTKGPQYLFGNSTVKVKARIDLIEWTGDQVTADAKSPKPTP
jgi:hypothetical protein